MRRWVLLAAATVATVMLSKLLVENVLSVDLKPAITGWLNEAGARSAAMIVLLLVADLVLPIPSSLVMVLSGAAFGAVRGAAIAGAGSIGCSILGFELARRYGRRAAARLVGEDDTRHLEATFERYGAGAVFVTRALPVMKEAMSVVAGLSAMPRATYIAAAVAGTIPEVAIYAWAGAQSREAGTIVPAVVILMALGAAGWIVRRNRLARAG